MAYKSKGATRGIEHPISEDAALIGDTRMELQYKPLPKRTGPNFGTMGEGEGSECRDDKGTGQDHPEGGPGSLPY